MVVTLAPLTSAGVSHAQTPAAAPTTIAVGDWALAPTLELRARGEARGYPVDVGGVDPQGAVTPRVASAFGGVTRARLGLGAERGPVRAQVTLQDARAWGAVPPSAVLAGGAPFGETTAYEAFAEVHTTSSPTRASYLRVGRQAVRWGDGLLLGHADWSPTPRALDAARGVVVFGDGEAEVLAALVDTARPLGPGFGDVRGPFVAGSQLYGARVAWAFDPLLKLEAAGLLRVARSAAALEPGSRFAAARASGETMTSTLRVSGKRGLLEYAADGAVQLGDRIAWATAAHVAVKLDNVLTTPVLRAGGAYASGDDGGPELRQFDPILPDVHDRFGAMDAFAWSNLFEVHGRVTATPVAELRATLEYRYARLARTAGEWRNAYLQYVGAGAGGETELGHELDAGITWYPWPVLALHGGYSALLLGDAARALLSSRGRGALRADGSFAPPDLAHAAWLQATVRVP